MVVRACRLLVTVGRPVPKEKLAYPHHVTNNCTRSVVDEIRRLHKLALSVRLLLAFRTFGMEVNE